MISSAPLPAPARRRRLLALVFLSIGGSIVPAACHDDPALTAPADRVVALLAAEGHGQVGRVGEELSKSLVVTAVDARGAPMPYVEVQWLLPAGSAAGALTPLSPVTDQRGQTRARWTLGATEGPLEVIASVGQRATATFRATAGPRAPAPPVLRPLPLTTYDGSGQAVHPDYMATPDGWSLSSAFRHWLVVTPYPSTDETKENPSIFISPRMDGAWLPEPDAPAPLVRPEVGGHLSDPDLVYVPELHEIWLYYRHVYNNRNTVLLTRTSDGLLWSTPSPVASAPSHMIVSPSVAHRKRDDWLMWSVNGEGSGCTAQTTAVELRRSTDGVSWSEPESVELAQAALYPWHIDVQWIPSRNEFWAIYNAKAAGSCATARLYMATSPDGVRWTVRPTPVLVRGAIPEFQDIVYRSTFAYDAASDLVTFWYSGARHDGRAYVWSTAMERRLRTELFSSTAIAPSPSEGRTLASQRESPKLLRAP